ncbi:MAG: hypothetical protein MSIBF_00545 [Candidatus Altiarchaeales archaeon IMC4]|nr:MAG: hypothetical protein MSIBF_00545 [Candidatus Altiarchaeales archaeon IMC4]
MNKIILELSREHEALPKAELAAVLEVEGGRVTCEFSNIAIVESENHNFVNRLAFTKSAALFVAKSGDISDIGKEVSKHINGTFAVRTRLKKSETIEKELGAEIAKYGHKVNLKNPDTKVVCFKNEGKYVAGIDIHLPHDFEARRPKFRPFFHPTSMHPKLARCLVNLARVKKGDTVLDPFCGTGGILIEAGLMGMKPIGIEINKECAQGCRRNMEHYGLTGEIICKDALEAKITADAVVTDLPYGRSSFMSSTGLQRDFLLAAHRFVREGGYIVVVLPKGKNIKPKKTEIVNHYDVRVHKSLTRRVWVFRKVSQS